jgi:hypothetical protein
MRYFLERKNETDSYPITGYFVGRVEADETYTFATPKVEGTVLSTVNEYSAACFESLSDAKEHLAKILEILGPINGKGLKIFERCVECVSFFGEIT